MKEISTAGTTTDIPVPIGPETALTEKVLAQLWQSKREAFLSHVRVHLSPKLERRIDASDVVQAAFLRARDRMQWLGDSLTPEELDKKLDRIVCEQTIDQLRSVLGAKRNS
jgi:hypothetical protein